MQVANTSIIDKHYCIAIWLSKRQDQKLLTLYSHSLLSRSSDRVTSIFAHDSSQYCEYALKPFHGSVMVQNVRPEIEDAPLILISRTGQWVCCSPIYLQRLPIQPLGKDVPIQPFDCHKSKSKKHWCSIHAYLQEILTHIVCSTFVHKMHTAIVHSKYIVSVYNHLHPNASRSLSF